MRKQRAKKKTNTQKRISARLDVGHTATLVFPQGIRKAVTIQNVSAKGFAVLANDPVANGTELILEESSEAGIERYHGHAVFCRPQKRAYQIGIAIQNWEPEMVFLKP